MAQSREKVSVTCAECGHTRSVRATLIRGFDALVCAHHRLTEAPASLVVPDGHLVAITPDVAGYFTGYTVSTPTPAQARSIWRATALAAAATGRPAPPPPPDDDLSAWQPVIDALTAKLGPDGWELADADSERGRRGRVWTVKIYTDFGWAGFLEGSPRQIAADLAAIRDDYARQTAAAGLTCPHCDADLSPTAPASRCDCGSIAWRPVAWNAHNPVSVIADALAYLDDAPPYEVAAEQVLLTCLLEPHIELYAGDPRLPAVTFEDIAAALQVLVPNARWATIGERLRAVLPVGARWEGGRAAQLRQAASALGYDLVRTHPIDDLRIPCLAAGDDTDRSLPKWFDVTAADEGWQLRIDADAGRLRQRYVDDHPDVDDEDLGEAIDQVLDDLILSDDDVTWAVTTNWWEGALAVARPIDDPCDLAALTAALREGAEAVAALHATISTRVTAFLRDAE
ncbi:hypothetical protein ONA91_40100 [Micromonospora sp. DR5-3]|uniref:hypothetical protein n=1 Tax=unclassified Micromonospora TaxID=2617518 RepID=UPI0011D58DB6|nr:MULTISPECIES: hypothetical protein [unclassified Micromonospora]MCW3820653.1 hypothetical protein [Micromonospora sp. DR5-3]TYC17789.1 hypothetical protein FXF52_39130 [Micromonospora sp. MP36]